MKGGILIGGTALPGKPQAGHGYGHNGTGCWRGVVAFELVVLTAELAHEVAVIA